MSLCLISVHNSWLLVSAWGMGLGSRIQLLYAAILIPICLHFVLSGLSPYLVAEQDLSVLCAVYGLKMQ